VYETHEDHVWLQSLLDRSYRRAGEHLRSITTPARRISAVDLCDLLPGVQILEVATVTADGRPRVAPVDGLFFRGHFYFGSSRTSLRYRHLHARPRVSAVHTRGEEVSVVVHGTPWVCKIEEGYPNFASFNPGAKRATRPGRSTNAIIHGGRNMGRFMLLYVGPATPANASHKGWPEWFAKLGDRLIDRGSPMANGLVLRTDGSTRGSTTHLNGYSIVQAEDVKDVLSVVKDHPYQALGGEYSIEAYSLD